jgi:hypothetical protein
MKIELNEKIDSLAEFSKNLWAFVTGRTITFRQYITMECREIFGDDNRWYSGENLNHSPTDIDCQNNYLRYAGDKRFREKHRYLVERPWQKNVREKLLFLRDFFAIIIRQRIFRNWASN